MVSRVETLAKLPLALRFRVLRRFEVRPDSKLQHRSIDLGHGDRGLPTREPPRGRLWG